MNFNPTPHQIKRVRHELRIREVEVVRVLPLSKNFISVTFSGEDLADFTSLSFDDHIKFMFTNAKGEAVRRDYTPREFNVEKRELTIEFALHDGGDASAWAQQATVGQHVSIGGPRGSMVIPMDYDWYVLIGDATALPAIHRRIEELPQNARATVIMQIADLDDSRQFQTQAEVAVTWVTDSTALIAAIKSLNLAAGDGFIWCAGEASSMATIKQILLTDKNHSSKDMSVGSYWKQGLSDFHERL